MPREIPKERVLEMLRGRGDHGDAALADLELPDPVDPDRDAGLLTKFGVHPPELIASLSIERTVLEDMPNFRCGPFNKTWPALRAAAYRARRSTGS